MGRHFIIGPARQVLPGLLAIPVLLPAVLALRLVHQGLPDQPVQLVLRARLAILDLLVRQARQVQPVLSCRRSMCRHRINRHLLVDTRVAIYSLRRRRLLV